MDVPMPSHSRTRLRVWRKDLLELRNDCNGIKRRSRPIPYLYTVGWSCLTAAAYAAVGLINASSVHPHPDHRVYAMYWIGLIGGIVIGLIFLAWGDSGRKNFRDDLDDLIKKIEGVDYAADIED